LVLYTLYQARHLRLPRWELVRLGLGLLIPLLLIPHIFGTRVLAQTNDFDDTYAYVVYGMWVEHPTSAIPQVILLLVAWTHGCMGIRWWLQFRPWYPKYRPALRGVALVLPTAALAGFASIGNETYLRSMEPGWVERTFAGITPAQENAVGGWSAIATGVFIAAVVITFVGRYARTWLQRRRGAVCLTYPGGRRVTIPSGMTILEASRQAGIPHASLCGGRGRCSTCRSRVGPPSARVPLPSTEEARVLKRVGAPPNVRLACQLRPTGDLNVIPLLPPTVETTEGLLRPSYAQGSEQELAILFADLRGFTKFSEHKLPYDVVFVMNQYFKAMGEAVEASGGYLDKFIGDGVMALFGINSSPERGCRQALDAAVAMSQALDELNQVLSQDLAEPLRIGLGIHAGPVIVGDMGYGHARTLTAIGDAVNTASRLETMNKEFHSELIFSEEVATRAGVDPAHFGLHEIEVRGRTTLLPIRVVPKAHDLLPVLLPGETSLSAAGRIPRPPLAAG
jgi:adenylate cyclase